MRSLLLLLCVLSLAGCGSTAVQNIVDGRKVDYERDEYQDRRALQFPPDIIAAEKEKGGAQLLSEYRIGAVPNINQPDEVALTGTRKVYYRRDGNLRWIDLDLPAGDSWSLARSFWGDLKFELIGEDPKVGTLETDWLDLRRGATSVGLGGYLDNFLNRVRDSGERDKFITRVESNGDVSSIFVAHRRISAKFDNQGLFSGYEPLPADAQLEIEMLRRIMIFAAATPEGETQENAFAEDIAAAEEDGDYYELAETLLHIDKPVAESWLLVRIGLDRGGFTIEDQDHAERAYYIRHTGGPESQQIFGKAETNFFNKIFGEEKPILREIKLTLESDSADATTVRVISADDEDELTVAQQSVLLELLSINLP